MDLVQKRPRSNTVSPPRKHRKRSTSSKKKHKHGKTRYTDSSESSSSSSDTSSTESSSSSDDSRSRRKKRKLKKKKSRRKRDTSSDSSEEERQKRKKERKKKKKKKKKAKKKLKEAKRVQENSNKEIQEPSVTKPTVVQKKQEGKALSGPAPRVLKPMTKEEWEKQQSVVRRVYDPETGRDRLIKGDGEVIEEIVSRERHKEINQQSTRGDGLFFQSKMGLLPK
ncbi:ADP-ribosylation factor-like protein 6-interacting protein 4 [Mizuhopecten yessoensis]|uniref:ADP-ribosylation factor-like protein 6-interacting protein 4 n=1 Tax=Mizuhopecten yessoensis TaxID=6573 RepID=A0A210QTV8_MIZYE|nr:ADP-ribosylation factor-like protein 6-interacting protein 4 [Mizuhopecten yessoensis]OWF52154.1 ADP-ribosylation factor-like protein 6-interacting protein 4 [Mizuhopecten yessoensis]